jgi:hypothetical protein
MQQRLCIAAGLLFAFEDEVAGCLVGCAFVVASHVFVEWVASVLAIDHFRHALQGFFDLPLSYYALVQLACHVLATDAQGGALS